jgi:hypothetical protein
MENDGQRQMETRLASDVAQLPRNGGQFLEKYFDERENFPAKHPETGRRWQR